MITFIYTYGKIDRPREKVCFNVFNKLRSILDLPTTLEIEFSNLTDSVYAQTILDYRFKNRIRINSALTAKETIVPLVHELIHIHQIHIGKLAVYRNGMIFWEGNTYNINNMDVMDYKSYLQLPWEVDVANKEKNILAYILDN